MQKSDEEKIWAQKSFRPTTDETIKHVFLPSAVIVK